MLLTQNLCSDKLLIQTNVLGVILDDFKNKYKFLTYMTIVIVSCIIFQFSFKR